MLNRIYIVMAFALFFCNQQHVSAQRFGAAVLAGTSISQIQGDKLAGYHKLGFTGGIKGITYINNIWNVNVELLFTQRGSRNDLVPDNSIPRTGIDLNYVEVPVYAEVKDWEINPDEGTSYSKVSAHAGFSYGRLISSAVLEFPEFILDEFKSNDLSYLIGARFQWNQHWGVSARYTRSVIPAATVTDQMTNNKINFIPYSISFRLEYVL